MTQRIIYCGSYINAKEIIGNAMGVTLSAPFVDAAVPSGARVCSRLLSGACKQAGGHCYYMAVINFMTRAKPQLVAAGCTGEWFEPIWAFAARVARCSTSKSVARACETPPVGLQRAYEALVRGAGTEWEQVPVGDGTFLPEGGNPYLLMLAVLSGAAHTNRAVHGMTKPNSDDLYFDSTPSGPRGSVVVVLVRYMIEVTSPDVVDNALRKVTNAVARWGSVLGGTFSFDHGPSDAHAMSWNVCSGRRKPYDIVVCNSAHTQRLGLDVCAVGAHHHMRKYAAATLTDIVAVVVLEDDEAPRKRVRIAGGVTSGTQGGTQPHLRGQVNRNPKTAAEGRVTLSSYT